MATGLFERATRLDPGLGAAFAARAFARSQDGMQEYKQDRDGILADINALAQKAMALNPYDRFVTMTMGRCHWLAAMPEEGIFWYDHAIQLCPRDSNVHYSRALPDAPPGPAAVSRVG